MESPHVSLRTHYCIRVNKIVNNAFEKGLQVNKTVNIAEQ